MNKEQLQEVWEIHAKLKLTAHAQTDLEFVQ
jgi:hypothetical protein